MQNFKHKIGNSAYLFLVQILLTLHLYSIQNESFHIFPLLFKVFFVIVYLRCVIILLKYDLIINRRSK
jgi:hypothetical protein